MKILKAAILIAAILSVFAFIIFGLAHAVFGGMWAQAHGGGKELLTPILSGLLLVASGVVTALMLWKENFGKSLLFTYAATQALLSIFISSEIVKETNISPHDITGPYILYGVVLMVNSGWVLAIWKALEKQKVEPDELVNASSAAGLSENHLND